MLRDLNTETSHKNGNSTLLKKILIPNICTYDHKCVMCVSQVCDVIILKVKMVKISLIHKSELSKVTDNLSR